MKIVLGPYSGEEHARCPSKSFSLVGGLACCAVVAANVVHADRVLTEAVVRYVGDCCDCSVVLSTLSRHGSSWPAHGGGKRSLTVRTRLASRGVGRGATSRL